MTAGVANAISRSRTNHELPITPDVVKANSPRMISQTKARDLYVYCTEEPLRHRVYKDATDRDVLTRRPADPYSRVGSGRRSFPTATRERDASTLSRTD